MNPEEIKILIRQERDDYERRALYQSDPEKRDLLYAYRDLLSELLERIEAADARR